MRVYINIPDDRPDKVVQVYLARIWKYKIMWELREFEKQIQEQGGCLVYGEYRGMMLTDIKGFSGDLRDKIELVCKKVQNELEEVISIASEHIPNSD